MVNLIRRMLNPLSVRKPAASGREAEARRDMALDGATLKRMARMIALTADHEIGCAECFRLLDEFVDMKLAGKNAAQAMPLVQEHLDRCTDCREEFEALLAALRGLG